MTETAFNIGVVGAGLMGTEIAFVHALAGNKVTLVDNDARALASANQKLDRLYERGVARSLYSQDEKLETLSRIRTYSDTGALAACNVVVEAVFERLDVKAKVIENLNLVCKSDCLITTNTSTIPISVLASYLSSERRPRFIGTHFFSPVSRMALVEVIPAIETSPSAVECVMTLCRQIGKTPIKIKDVTGFAVNRLLHVLMIEAVRLVEEGVASPEDIDLACKLGLGHPMGPFELMDATTSSLCLQAQQIMFDAYGERFRPRPLLKQRVMAGYTGGRNNKGWRS